MKSIHGNRGLFYTGAMIRFLPFLLILLFPLAASAQIDLPSPNAGKEGEIISQPICSALVNRSDQTILGTLSTAGQQIETGEIIRHQDNFRLAAGERKEFCATGPFYEGQRLEVVLRTLLPLFDCKTKINHEIFLDALPNQYGFKKLSATCD